MNYFRTCNLASAFIDNYSISEIDLNLFYRFLNQNDYFDKFYNDHHFFDKYKSEIVEEWFYFLQKSQSKQNPSETKTYGNTVYRATFGSDYTLEQLATSPLHYSAGSNGTGLYAATNDPFGKGYIKNHLSKQFKAFDQKIGNVLKINLAEDAKVMSKIDIHRARDRFLQEINHLDIHEDLKTTFCALLTSDISISAMLLGADVMYMPNGHVVVLNKDALLLPETQEDFDKSTLKVNLEKFRDKDMEEVLKVDSFLQQ